MGRPARGYSASPPANSLTSRVHIALALRFTGKARTAFLLRGTQNKVYRRELDFMQALFFFFFVSGFPWLSLLRGMFMSDQR